MKKEEILKQNFSSSLNLKQFPILDILQAFGINFGGKGWKLLQRTKCNNNAKRSLKQVRKITKLEILLKGKDCASWLNPQGPGGKKKEEISSLERGTD